ncbi:tumor necrosis factor receptor superfamily member 23-like isoform X2 [Myxocyprinus asiaticus]|uniref:tumor necrosis factor receptor superfamily member 23-like isoform X2 n=1 Tax=Myxocyprinus asiaticus TaxID=70543 RepID=UPI00222152F9|nr:tumor necrosis factor receptor superfamily member 23-like isoform X2 [Myxocyprinus asiaticus]
MVHGSFFSSNQMFTLLSILLLSSHALSLVQSLNCDEKTEYSENNQCCKKCKQGEMMSLRCKPGLHDTHCEPCHNGYFTDSFNNNFMKCFQCTKCTKEYMKYAKNCTLTHDAECICDEGYQCSGEKCQMCVKVLQTTTTAVTMFTRPTPPTDMYDHMNGSCQHQPVSGPPKRATSAPVSAQRKRKYQCQCRRCVERQRNWRKSEKGGRRQLMHLWIEYLLYYKPAAAIDS